MQYRPGQGKPKGFYTFHHPLGRMPGLDCFFFTLTHPMKYALLALATCLALTSLPASARTPSAAVVVTDAWVRPSVAGQAGTGGFMTLTSDQDLTLQGFSSPVASTAELHEMSLEGDVMRMRPIDALPLPKGQAVQLKPGGHHLMLIGLKTPLKVGTQVPVQLLLKDASGKLVKQRVKLPVLRAAPGPAEPSAAQHDHHHHHGDH